MQVIHHLVPGQDEDGATFVRRLKCAPADFAPVQRTSCQPSASHDNRSSSLENSLFRGGRARYRSRSSAAGGALMKRRSRRRSSGDKQSTKGKISSALRCFGIRPILPANHRTSTPGEKPRRSANLAHLGATSSPAGGKAAPHAIPSELFQADTEMTVHAVARLSVVRQTVKVSTRIVSE